MFNTLNQKIHMLVSFASEDMPEVNVEVNSKQHSDFHLLMEFMHSGDINSLALDSEIDRDRFKVRALAFLGLISDSKYKELEKELTDLE